MPDSFAASARRLAGQAMILCGWTPDVFWNATPEDLSIIVEALRGNCAAPPDTVTLARLRKAFPDG